MSKKISNLQSDKTDESQTVVLQSNILMREQHKKQETKIVDFLKTDEGKRGLLQAIHIWLGSDEISRIASDNCNLYSETPDSGSRHAYFNEFRKNSLGRPDFLLEHENLKIVIECSDNFDLKHLRKDYDYLREETFFKSNPNEARLLLLVGPRIDPRVVEQWRKELERLTGDFVSPPMVAHLGVGFGGVPEQVFFCFTETAVTPVFERYPAKNLFQKFNSAVRPVLKELDEFLANHKNRATVFDLMSIFGVGKTTMLGWLKNVENDDTSSGGAYVYTNKSINKSAQIRQFREAQERGPLVMVRYEKDTHVFLQEIISKYFIDSPEKKSRNSESFKKRLEKGHVFPIGFCINPNGGHSDVYDRKTVEEWLQMKRSRNVA